MEETKRWDRGVVGFGSGANGTELLDRMSLPLVERPFPHEPEAPAVPQPFSGLNRRQRRELRRKLRG